MAAEPASRVRTTPVSKTAGGEGGRGRAPLGRSSEKNTTAAGSASSSGRTTPGSKTAAGIGGGRASRIPRTPPRTPLSSVDSNSLARKGAPRTPSGVGLRKTGGGGGKIHGKIHGKIGGGGAITKKKQPKSTKTRRKNEIYCPLVANGSAQVRRSDGAHGATHTPQSPSIVQAPSNFDSGDEPLRPSDRNVGGAGKSEQPGASEDAHDEPTPGVGQSKRSEAREDARDEPTPVAPVARLGGDLPPPILNFGHRNVVGETRSVPLRIEAPPPSSRNSLRDPGAELFLEAERVPPGFEIVAGGAAGRKSIGDDANSPSTIPIERAGINVLRALWTPAREGEVREEIRLRTPWGRLEVTAIGIARGPSTLERPNRQDRASFFYGRDNITHTPRQWEDLQCRTFADWLNSLFRPKDEGDPFDKEKVRAERKSATELFRSPEMRAVRRALEREARVGRLALARTNRNALDEVHVRERLTELLMGYGPRWLQLGLGIVLGLEDDPGFERKNQMTKEELKRIVTERVLSEPGVVRKYTGGKCKTPSGKFESQMRTKVHRHALSRVMTLVYFLDRAKVARVLRDDPCLFERSSETKSSEEVLVSLCQDCFSVQGSVIRHLKHEGVGASHVQEPLDEYDFRVRNLAADLKDGACLARMIDVVADGAGRLPSMRLPADARQDKMRNVSSSLSALRRMGVPGIADVTAAHVVSAHQPRILQLLWSTIMHFELPRFEKEILDYKASRLIQSRVRRFLGRRSYRVARRGTVSFQALYRGFVVRLRNERRSDAATNIQRTWRGYSAKLSYGFVLMDVIVAQSVCRRFLARKHVDEMRRIMNDAATEIQRAWRGYRARSGYGRARMAVATVQSVCRRFLAQNRFRRLFEVTKGASTQIQKIWRGYRAKINYRCDLMGIIAVQSLCRRVLSRNRVAALSETMGDACVDIQRAWRGYRAKLSYGFDLMDIIAVQSAGRRFAARRAAARRREAARKIRSAARMWAAKRLYRDSRRSVRAIQGLVRRVLASNLVRHLKSLIVRLQRVCRGWLCRKRMNLVSDRVDRGKAHIQSSPRLRDPGQNNEEVSFRTNLVASGKMEKSAVEMRQVSTVLCANVNKSTPVGRSSPMLQNPETAIPSTREALALPNKEISFTGKHTTKRSEFCMVGNVAKLVDEIEQAASDAGAINHVSSKRKTLKARSSPSNLKASVVEDGGERSSTINNATRKNHTIENATELAAAESRLRDYGGVAAASERFASGAGYADAFSGVTLDSNVPSATTKHVPRRREVAKVARLDHEAEQGGNVGLNDMTTPILSFSLSRKAPVLRGYGGEVPSRRREFRSVQKLTRLARETRQVRDVTRVNNDINSSSVDGSAKKSTPSRLNLSSNCRGSMLREDAEEISLSAQCARRLVLCPLGDELGQVENSKGASIDSNLPKVITHSLTLSSAHKSSVPKDVAEEISLSAKHAQRILGDEIEKGEDAIRDAHSRNDSSIDSNFQETTTPSFTFSPIQKSLALKDYAEERSFSSKHAPRESEINLKKVLSGVDADVHDTEHSLIDNDSSDIHSSAWLHQPGVICSVERENSETQDELFITTKHAYRRRELSSAGKVKKIDGEAERARYGIHLTNSFSIAHHSPAPLLIDETMSTMHAERQALWPFGHILGDEVEEGGDGIHDSSNDSSIDNNLPKVTKPSLTLALTNESSVLKDDEGEISFSSQHASRGPESHLAETTSSAGAGDTKQLHIDSDTLGIQSPSGIHLPSMNCSHKSKDSNGDAEMFFTIKHAHKRRELCPVGKVTQIADEVERVGYGVHDSKSSSIAHPARYNGPAPLLIGETMPSMHAKRQALSSIDSNLPRVTTPSLTFTSTHESSVLKEDAGKISFSSQHVSRGPELHHAETMSSAGADDTKQLLIDSDTLGIRSPSRIHLPSMNCSYKSKDSDGDAAIVFTTKHSHQRRELCPVGKVTQIADEVKRVGYGVHDSKSSSIAHPARYNGPAQLVVEGTMPSMHAERQALCPFGKESSIDSNLPKLTMPSLTFSSTHESSVPKQDAEEISISSQHASRGPEFHPVETISSAGADDTEQLLIDSDTLGIPSPSRIHLPSMNCSYKSKDSDGDAAIVFTTKYSQQRRELFPVGKVTQIADEVERVGYGVHDSKSSSIAHPARYNGPAQLVVGGTMPSMHAERQALCPFGKESSIDSNLPKMTMPSLTFSSVHESSVLKQDAEEISFSSQHASRRPEFHPAETISSAGAGDTKQPLIDSDTLGIQSPSRIHFPSMNCSYKSKDSDGDAEISFTTKHSQQRRELCPVEKVTQIADEVERVGYGVHDSKSSSIAHPARFNGPAPSLIEETMPSMHAKRQALSSIDSNLPKVTIPSLTFTSTNESSVLKDDAGEISFSSQHVSRRPEFHPAETMSSAGADDTKQLLIDSDTLGIQSPSRIHLPSMNCSYKSKDSDGDVEISFTTKHAHKRRELCPVGKVTQIADEVKRVGYGVHDSKSSSVAHPARYNSPAQLVIGGTMPSMHAERQSLCQFGKESSIDSNLPKVTIPSLTFSSTHESSVLKEDAEEISFSSQHASRGTEFHHAETMSSAGAGVTKQLLIDSDRLGIQSPSRIHLPSMNCSYKSKDSDGDVEISFTTKHSHQRRELCPVGKVKKIADEVERVGYGLHDSKSSSIARPARYDGPAPLLIEETMSTMHAERKALWPFGHILGDEVEQEGDVIHDNNSNDSPIDSNLPKVTIPSLTFSSTHKSSVLKDDAGEISFSSKHASRGSEFHPAETISSAGADDTKQLLIDSDTLGIQSPSRIHLPSMNCSCKSKDSDGDAEIFFTTKHARQRRELCPIGKVTQIADEVERVSYGVHDSKSSSIAHPARCNGSAPLFIEEKMPSIRAERQAFWPFGHILGDEVEQEGDVIHDANNSNVSSIDSNLPKVTIPSLTFSSTHESSVLKDDVGEISFSSKHASRGSEFHPAETMSSAGADDTKQLLIDSDTLGIQSPSRIHLPSMNCSYNSKDSDRDAEIFFTTKHAHQRRELCPVGKVTQIADEVERVGYGLHDSKSSSIAHPARYTGPAPFSIRETMASVRIQNMWRRYSVSKLFVAKKKAVVTCQTNCRRVTAKREVEVQMSLQAVATKITTTYRGHAERSKYATIQEFHRKYIARKSIEELQFAILNRGVLSLQAQARGFIARAEVRSMKIRREMAASKLQKICRRVAAFRSKRTSGATTIQCAFRRYVLVDQYCSLRKSIVLAQALCRGRKSRRETAAQRAEIQKSILFAATLLDQKQSSAAVQIQRMWRGYMVNVDFMLLILATIKIQSIVRFHLATIKYRQLRNGVVCAQARFRGRKASQRFATVHKSTCILQRFCRIFLATRKVHRVVAAVSKLQRAVRIMISSVRDVHCIAATEIQRVWRGYKANVDFMLLVISSIKIQAFVRSRHTRKVIATQHESIRILQNNTRRFLARLSMHRVVLARHNERECFAATEIQRTWRGYRANINFRVMVIAAATIQAVVRDRQASHAANQRTAISTLQRAARFMLTQMHNGVRCFAATEIQRVWKGYGVKLKFLVMANAATMIQAVVRGRQASRDAAVKRTAISTLQKAARFMLTRIHSEVRCFAVTEIQRVWRGYRANIDFMLTVISSIKIQAFVRGWQARKDMTTQLRSIHILQNAGRRFLARLEMHRLVAATFTLQRAARIMIASMHNEVKCFSATEIQRTWRGCRVKRKLHVMAIAATRIQAVGRRRRAGRDVAIQRNAISTLQRAARVMQARMHSEVHCFAATEIQRIWRGYRANVDFMVTVISAIKVQSVARGRKVRQNFATQLKGIRALQVIGRVFLVKRKMCRVVAAAITIQRAVRVMITRVNRDAECFAAACAIQHIWRGYRANIDFKLFVLSTVTIQSFARRILAEAKAAKQAKERLASHAEKERIENEQVLAYQRLSGSRQMKFHSEGNVATVNNSGRNKKEEVRSNFAEMQTSSQIKRVMLPPSTPPYCAKSKAQSFSDSISRNRTVHSSSRLRQAGSSCRAAPNASEVHALPKFLHIPSLQAGARQSSKYEKHTTKAMRTIQTSKKFSEVMKAMLNLEKITQRSTEDCKLLVAADAHHKMFSIIRSCNRSSPHLELIRVILSVLTNLAQHRSTLADLANEKAVDALSDLVHMFRDKSKIIALSASLLEKMLRTSKRLTSTYSTQENTKRLNSILLMSKKKTSKLDGIQKGIHCLENILHMMNASRNQDGLNLK